MKRSLAFLLIAFAAIPCSAQWKYTGFGDLSGDEVGADQAFGVHDTCLFAGYVGNGIWRYTFSTGWTAVNNGLDLSQGNVTSFASHGPYVFAGMTHSNGSNGPVYQSSDNGLHWPNVIVGGPIGTDGRYLFGTFVSPDELVRSSDDGETWDSVTNLVVNNFAATGACILATANGSIYRSTDSGTHWAQTTPPAGLSLSAFAVMDTQIFAGGTGVFRSTDSGLNWTQIALSTRKVNALAVYGAYMFAAIDTGVLVSSDSGKNWHDVSTGMGTRPGFPRDVTLLAILDTQLFAEVYTGTDASNNQYGYVAARPISEMTNPDSTESVVQTISAGDTIEVYPNPANGTVTILSGGTSILGVSVMDVLGVDVLDLPNLRESEISLDISKLPSGTYFLHIETANGSVLRKIVKEE